MLESAHRSDLELRAEEKIEAGELPAASAGRTRARGGSGQPCDLCCETVEKAGIEYEAEWQKAEGVRLLRFHLDCFQAWVCSQEELAD